MAGGKDKRRCKERGGDNDTSGIPTRAKCETTVNIARSRMSRSTSPAILHMTIAVDLTLNTLCMMRLMPSKRLYMAIPLTE